MRDLYDRTRHKDLAAHEVRAATATAPIECTLLWWLLRVSPRVGCDEEMGWGLGLGSI